MGIFSLTYLKETYNRCHPRNYTPTPYTLEHFNIEFPLKPLRKDIKKVLSVEEQMLKLQAIREKSASEVYQKTFYREPDPDPLMNNKSNKPTIRSGKY